MSYIKGTYLEEIIDRTVDGWAKIFGFVEDNPKRSRKKDGTYEGDDTNTPDVNEAWETGKSPSKKKTIHSIKTKRRTKK